MILGLPEGPWTDEDRLLVLALQHHEDGLCSCGHHREEAWDEKAAGHYEVKTYECEACATRQRHEKQHEGRERADGQKVTVYDATLFDL